MAEIKLRPYQEEVVQRALKGENTIIWLPTGAGKTRAAVYVAKKHLESNPHAKVVVMVNMIHLANQHYESEFSPYLGDSYKIKAVSSDSPEKDFFGSVIRLSDVVICTAQILYNAMTSREDLKHLDLSAITLLIIDECHHTIKEGVYNKIMRTYVERTLRDERPLPQILGLTASPGAGRAKDLEKAVEHVLQVCANLDAEIVSTRTAVHDLETTVPRPKKVLEIVEKRPVDPFGSHLKWMMGQIHEFMPMPSGFCLRECGTQEYEADVVELEKIGATRLNKRLQQCALHLRQYNDALLINDTLRMIDAFRSLLSFYNTKLTYHETDEFLVRLFRENQAKLKKMADDTEYENPKMARLESTLLKHFVDAPESRALLFSKTRKSTGYLNDWIQSNSALQDAGIKSAILTGVGNMTQCEQLETIANFRCGKLNLLVSTSVAEEGLNIQECNLVVRYGLLTNEIAQKQASGRARAANGEYSVVADKNGKELKREFINEQLDELTRQAIAAIQEMSRAELRSKIRKIQRESLSARKAAESTKKCNVADDVVLLCRECHEPVARGSDIRVVDNVHYVNINPRFRKFYKLGALVVLDKSFADMEPGHMIACQNCGKDWGSEIKYKGIAVLPNISIKHFTVEMPSGRVVVKKWKKVPFMVEEFNLSEYCEENGCDPLD
ncbi:probable ATP-dependent RNA helicase DHX58 isoform X1 [Synchiropus splendidus]|uniref:probable ATP-dependent RNA helicase DHX58 isoform X1 n=2 Tax=Synchiropus splendidus TaxID=270530 RepID=UPI00237DDCE6|nr:probable ATP-dependent RNA helicase DHX58 isoform X1 [Synchiropus splendidus]